MGVSPSSFDVLNCTDQNETKFLTNETVSDYLYSPLETVIIIYIMPIMLLVCLAGNFTFFMTVWRVKRMRNTTNLYLINLSIADICFLSVCVGEKFYRFYNVGIPSYGELLGTWGCVLIYMCVYTPYFTSIMIVTLVSIERYFAICLPLKHMIVWSKRRTVVVVTGSWIFSTIIAGTMLPGYTKLEIKCLIWPDDEKYDNLPIIAGYCGPFGTGALAYENFIQTIPFFIASSANSVFYACIIAKMNHRTRIQSRDSNSVMMRAKLVQVRNQVSRMLVVNGIVFFCCQAPYEFGCFIFFIQTIILDTKYVHTDEFLMSDEQFRQFLWIARLLLYINAAVNPLVFNCTSPRYRQAFRAAFTRYPNKIKSSVSRVADDCVNSSDTTGKTTV